MEKSRRSGIVTRTPGIFSHWAQELVGLASLLHVRSDVPRATHMPPSSPETRASLILRLQNTDDVAAWDEFVRLYRPVLYRVARGRGFQAADADNLVQEVMFAVARSVSQWLERADRGSFRAWLLRITRNEAVDTISRRATRPLGRDGAAAARAGRTAGAKRYLLASRSGVRANRVSVGRR